jgi:MoxR-like ATPase
VIDYTRQQPNPMSPVEVQSLCVALAPEPIPPQPPVGGVESLDPQEILDALRATTDDLVLEEGLLESIASAIAEGHLILTGPPGSAKSTLANRLATAVKGKTGWLPATATAEWTVHDVVGGYMPGTEQTALVFEPGLVLEAFSSQRWLVVDELNRADIDKAFGELFTILSGFPVVLPQRDPTTGSRVTVGPVGSDDAYTVPGDWRLIGTMNTWDKTSLFRLSYAFMRRFAFVEVAVPPTDPYEQLISEFVASYELSLSDETTLALYEIFAGDSLRAVQRELGPGVAKSTIASLGSNLALGLSEGEALASALRAYVLPQFEGAFEHHDQLAAALRSALVDIAGTPPAVADNMLRNLASWTGGEVH